MAINKKLFIFLFLLTTLIGIFNYKYANYYLEKLFFSSVAITLVSILKWIVEKVGAKRIKNSRTKYSFKKAISIISGLLFLMILARIWVKDIQALLVLYGLIGAGIAIGLQDFFKNFVGGIILFSSGTYHVGDRIQIDDVYGDVVDIGIMYTSLMEIRGWVDGDQVTGRITSIPNSAILSKNINNYTKEHNFIWEEIKIPITYESNWKAASKVFLEIVKKETKETISQAEKEITRMEERYYISKRPTEPAIFIKLTDNWIEFNIRYVVEAKQRRITHNKITTLILEQIEKSKNISIASTTLKLLE